MAQRSGEAASAAAGIIGVLLTRGRPTVIYPESVLTFRLEAPVAFSTDRAPQAFRYVDTQDYGGGQPSTGQPSMGQRLSQYRVVPFRRQRTAMVTAILLRIRIRGYGYGYPYPFCRLLRVRRTALAATTEVVTAWGILSRRMQRAWRMQAVVPSCQRRLRLRAQLSGAARILGLVIGFGAGKELRPALSKRYE